MPAELNVDWELIKGFIVAGNSFKSASDRFGVEEQTIRKRASRHEWPSLPQLSTRVSKTIEEKAINGELTRSLADEMLKRLETLKRKGADIAEKALDHALESGMKPKDFGDLKKAWDIGAEAVGLKQELASVQVAFNLGGVERSAEILDISTEKLE